MKKSFSKFKLQFAGVVAVIIAIGTFSGNFKNIIDLCNWSLSTFGWNSKTEKTVQIPHGMAWIKLGEFDSTNNTMLSGFDFEVLNHQGSYFSAFGGRNDVIRLKSGRDLYDTGSHYHNNNPIVKFQGNHSDEKYHLKDKLVSGTSLKINDTAVGCLIEEATQHQECTVWGQVSIHKTAKN